MAFSKSLPARPAPEQVVPDPGTAHRGADPSDSPSTAEPLALGLWDRLQSLLAIRWFWVPVLAFGMSRLGIFLTAYLAAPLFLPSANPPPYHLRPPENVLLDVLGSRWDTGFYLSIAEEGYRYDGVPLPSVPFFPLLPLIIRAAGWLTGDLMVAGVLVTNLALLLASLLLYRLADEEWGSAVAGRAVWYFLIFPTAFFGSAIYSESLFLLGAIGALYSARRGYWETAGLLALLTTLSRFMGLLVVPLLVLEWVRQRQSWTEEKRPSMAALLAPAAAPLGTLAYAGYLWRAFGDPLAFSTASAAWARSPQSPLALVLEAVKTPAEGWWSAFLAGRIHIDNWIDLTAVMAFLALGMVLLIQRRWGESAFVLLGTFIPLSSGLLMSQRRYVWVLFPAFILLARWGGRPWVDRLITTLSLIGLTLFTALFANGYWVG
jgi:hypothetical protein